MNCLLCNYKSLTVDDLIKHCTSYRKVNPVNFFFLQLFDKENALICRECIRCNEFLTTKTFMAKHNFLKHYLGGEKKHNKKKRYNNISDLF